MPPTSRKDWKRAALRCSRPDRTRARSNAIPKRSAAKARQTARRHRTDALVHPGPGLAAAEHAAEGATLDVQGLGAFQRNGGIIGAAGVRIQNPAAPFVLAGLHVDQNLFAILVRLLVDGISAEIGAALFDPDLAFLLFGQPDA